MENQWKNNGKSVEKPWKISGETMENRGETMENQWKNSGKSWKNNGKE